MQAGYVARRHVETPGLVGHHHIRRRKRQLGLLNFRPQLPGSRRAARLRKPRLGLPRQTHGGHGVGFARGLGPAGHKLGADGQRPVGFGQPHQRRLVLRGQVGVLGEAAQVVDAAQVHIGQRRQVGRHQLLARGREALQQVQRVQLAVQRVALGSQQAQSRKLGGGAKQPGLGELKLLLGPGHVQLLVFEALNGAVGQQVIKCGAQGAAFGIATHGQVAEFGQGGFELALRLVFHRLIVVPHNGRAQPAHVPSGETGTTVGRFLLIIGGNCAGGALVEAVAVPVEVGGVLLGQQRVQNGPGREAGRLQLRFEQCDGLLGFVFVPGLQQADFVEQRPHVGRPIASLFGLLINSFHQRRGGGGLVLAQQRVNLLPAGRVGPGRHGRGRINTENHGQKQAAKQEQAHGGVEMGQVGALKMPG